MKKLILPIIFALVCCIFPSVASAANVTWVGGTSTNWSTGSNWSTGAVPGVADTAIIGAGSPNNPEIRASITITSLQVNVNGVLSIIQDNGNRTFTVSGAVTNAGTINHQPDGASEKFNIGGNFTNTGTFNHTSGLVVFTNATTYTGTTTFLKVQINGSVTLAAGSVMTVTSTTAGDFTISAGKTFNNGSGTLNVKTFTNNGTYTRGTGTLILNNNMNVPATGISDGFYNLEIGTVGSSYTTTMTANLLIYGLLKINSGNTLNGAALNITMQGVANDGADWTCSGTYSSTGGTVFFYNGSVSAHLISGATIFKTVTFGTGAAAGVSTVAENAQITIGTALTVAASYTLNGSPSTSQASLITFNPATTFTVTGAFNPQGSTIDWKPTTNLRGSTNNVTYYNLVVSTAGSVNMNGAILTIGNDLTVQSGTTLTNTSNFPISIGGRWTNNGTATLGNSTVTFTSAAGLINSNQIFYNLTIGDGTGSDIASVAMGKIITVTNTMTLAASSTFNAGASSTLTLAGTVTIGGSAAFNEETSLIVLQGTTVPNFDATGTDYYDLKIDGAAITMATAIVVGNDLTVNASRTLNAGANSMYIGGNLAVAGTYTITGSTYLDGGGDQAISGAGTLTMASLYVDKASGTVSVSRDVTVSALFVNNGTFSIGGYTFTCNGTATIGDTVGSSQTSALLMSGACTLKITTALLINAPDGLLTATGTSGAGPTVTSTDEATPTRYSFTVNGYIDVGYLTVKYTNANGLNITVAIGASPNILTFDNLQFYNTAATASYAAKITVTSGTLTESFNAHYYDSTVADRNLYFTAPGSSGSSITMNSPTGAKIGETYTDDNDTDANVIWLTNHVWTGTTSSNWHTGSNWSVGTPPDSTNSVTIPVVGTSYPSISTADANLKNLTIDSGASLTVSSSRYLNIYGSFTIAGTFNAGNGTTRFIGTQMQTIPLGTYNDVIISNTSAACNIGGNSVFANLTLDSGAILNCSTFQVQISGTFTNDSGTFNADTSTLIFNGTSLQSVPSGTYNNLTISNSGTGVVAGGALTINGDLLINVSGIFSASNYSHGLAKNFTNSGTFNPDQSTISMTGSAAQVVSGVNFNNLIVSNTSGSVSFTGTSTLTINGNLTIGSGSVLDATNDTINIKGNWTSPGSFTSTSSTVVFNGTGTQYINTETFNVLQINNITGSVQISGDLIASTFTLTAGTVLSGAAVTHAINQTMTVGGIFTLESGSTLKVGSTGTAGVLTVNASSIFNMQDNTVLRMHGPALTTPAVTINGTFNSFFTSTSAKVQADVSSGPYYSFTVGNTGTIYVESLVFDSSNTAGMVINATATITALDNINFQNLQAGNLRALHIRKTSGTLNLYSLSFDATCIKNCRTEVGSVIINLFNSGGSNTGATYEDQAVGTQINWIANKTWTGADTTLWNSKKNWNPNTSIPTSSEAVFIPGGCILYPVMNANGNAKQVEIQSGGTLSMNNSNSTLTVGANFDILAGGTLVMDSFASSHLYVAGDWTNNGTFTQTIAGGTVYLQGISKFINGSTTFAELILSNASNYTLSNGASLTISAGGTFKVGDTALATLNGGAGTTITTPVWTHFAGSTWNPDTSTVVWKGGAIPSNVTSFYNLTIDSATASLAADIVVLNNLTINSGATLNASTRTITISGNFVNNGTFTFSAGAGVICDGTTVISGSGGSELTVGNLTVNSAKSLSLGALVNNRMTVTGNLSNSGSLSLVANTLEINGTFSSTGGTFTYGTSCLYMNTSVTQTLPYSSFYDLQTAGTATIRLSAATTIYNSLTLGGSSIFDCSPDGTNIYDITLKKNWSQTGTSSFTIRTSTVTLNGTSGQQITCASGGFYNLVINVLDTSTVTLGSGFSVLNNLNVTSGKLDMATGYTLAQSGSAAAINLSGGTLDVNKSSLSVAGNLIVSGTGILDITDTACALSVAGNITNTSTINGTGSTITVYCGGNWSSTAGFNIGNTKVSMTGAAKTITSINNADFYNLEINSSGTVSTSNGIDVHSNLTVLSGNLSLDGAYSHTVNGLIDNNATLTIGTSTVNLDGDLDNGSAASVLDFGAGGILKLKGSYIVGSGTLNEGTGKFEFNSTSANQSIPAETYYDVVINKTSKTATCAGNLTVSNSIAVSSGAILFDDGVTPRSHSIKDLTVASTASFSHASTTVTVSGALTNNGSFTVTAGTLYLSSGSATCDNNGTIMLSSSSSMLDVDGNLDNAGGTLSFNGNTGKMYLAGTLTAGTISSAQGTIYFDGNAGSTIPNSPTYYSVEVAKTSATATAGGALTISKNIKLASGTFDPGAFGHSIGGDWIETSGLFTAGAGSTITFDGASPSITTVAGNSFKNLTISVSGTCTLASSATITGNLSVSSGTLNLGPAFTHSVAGTTTITSVLNSGSSTTTFNDSVTVNGTLNIEDASVLKLSDTKSCTVNGTINSSFTTTRGRITSTNPGTDRFAFASNGTIYLNGLTFESPDSNGMTISSSATITDMDNVDFLSAPSGGTFLKVDVVAGSFNFSNLSFDDTFGLGSGYNVYLPTGNTITIELVNSSGNGQGEDYDNDDDNRCTWRNAVNWDAEAGTTSWNNATNWNPDVIPGITDAVVIPVVGTSIYPVIDVATATVRDLTLNSGASLSLGANTLAIKGSLVLSGTLNAGTGTILFNGIDSQTISTTTQTLNILEVNKVSGVLSAGSAVSTGTLTVTAGNFNVSSYLISVSGSASNSGTITFGTGTLSVASNVTNSGTLDFNNTTGTLKIGGSFTPGTILSAIGTVEFNGSTGQSIPAATYHHLKINKAPATVPEQTATASGVITVNGNFILADGKFDPGSSTHVVKGDWTESAGTLFQPTAGTISFAPTGSSVITMLSTNNFFNLTANGGSTSAASAVVLKINGALSVSGGNLAFSNSSGNSVVGNVTVSASRTLDIGSASVTISGDLSNSGTVDMDQNSAVLTVTGNVTNQPEATLSFGATSTATMNVGRNWTQNGTFQLGYSVISFNTTNNSSITTSTSADNFYDFKVNKSGTATVSITNSIDLNNDMVLTLGTLVASGALSIKVGGNWTVAAGNFTYANTTVVFDGNGGETISAEDFDILQVSSIGVGVALSGNVTVHSGLTVNSSAVLNLGSGKTLSVYGNVVNNGYLDFGTSYLGVTGSLTNSEAGSTLDLDQSGSSLECGSLTNSSSAIFTCGASSTATITCNGNWSNTATFTHGYSTVSLNNLSATITSSGTDDFYNLTIVGSTTPNNALDINNNLTINATSSLYLGAGYIYDVAGNLTVNGSLYFQTSTLRMSGVSKNHTVGASGAIYMVDSSIWKITNGSSVTISGAINCSSTSNPTEPQITGVVPGTDRYSFTLAGAININGLKFSSANSGGMTVNSTATFTLFDGVDFSNVPANASSNHLYIKKTTGSITANTCSFDRSFSVNGTTSPGYNVKTDAGSFAILFDNYSGAGAGSAFETQGAGSQISWLGYSTWTGMGGNANWDNSGNWTQGVAPDSGTQVTIPDIVTAGGGPYDPILNVNGEALSISMTSGANLNINSAFNLDVEQDITIASGATLTLSANCTIYCGGAFSNSGTFNQTNGKVCLDGGADGTGAVSSATFKTLEIKGDISFTSGTLRIVGATPSMTVVSPGIFNMSGTSTLNLGSGASFTVDLGGKLTTSDTPTITSDAPPAVFDLNINGTVDIHGLTFSYGDAEGFNVSSTASFEHFENITFTDAYVAGNGNLLTITQAQLNLAAPNLYFDGSFIPGTGYNISLSDTNGGNDVRMIVSFEANNGPGAGASYDYEGNTALIQWVSEVKSVTPIPGDYTQDTTVPTGIQGFVAPLYDYDTWEEVGFYAIIRQDGNDMVRVYNPDGTEKVYSPYTLDYGNYPDLGDIIGAPYTETTGTGASRKFHIFFGTTGGYIIKVRDTLAALEVSYFNIPDCTAVTSSVLATGTDLFFGGYDSVSGKNYMYGINYDGTPVANSAFPLEIYVESTSMPSYESLNYGSESKRWLHFATHYSPVDGRAFICRFDIDSGTVKQDYTPGATHVPSDDFTAPTTLGWNWDLYVGNQDGYLYGVQVSSSNYDPWPTFPKDLTVGLSGGVWIDFDNNFFFGDDAGVIHKYTSSTQAISTIIALPDNSPILSYPISLEDLPVYLYVGNANGKVYKVHVPTNSAEIMVDFGSGVHIRDISYSFISDKLLISTADGKIVLITP